MTIIKEDWNLKLNVYYKLRGKNIYLVNLDEIEEGRVFCVIRIDKTENVFLQEIYRKVDSKIISQGIENLDVYMKIDTLVNNMKNFL